MKGKIIAATSVLLGTFYLIILLTRESAEPSKAGNEVYHIGCYDIDRPLTYSNEVQAYLSSLSDQFNQTSNNKLADLKGRIQKSIFVQGGGNEIAREFEKYIASYQNIKSRNQYQQSFFNALKQTKDEFLQCREKFNENPWDCHALAAQYGETDLKFKELRGKLGGLMQRRADHLNKTEQLLKDEDVTKDIEFTEKYAKEIDTTNILIAKKHHKIKDSNETLHLVNNDIFKYETQLNGTNSLLEECSKNKKEIDFCKNISDYVTGLYDEVNLQEIERSMKKKRLIIDLLKAHLIQSKKLGEDVAIIEEELETAKRELEEEEFLYHETNNTGKCALELQFRCSQENIVELQRNITLITSAISSLHAQRDNLTTKINMDLYELQKFQEKISLLNEELKNNAVDINHLKLKEERKKKELKEYRETLNEIVVAIGQVNRQIAETKLQRVQENKVADRLMGRGEQLIECLGKKELYLKLDAKKPKNTEEDEILKRQAGRSLTATIKKIIGK